MPKPQDKLTAQIETAFRGVEEALRRRDPDTLAGRMPAEKRNGASPEKRADMRKKKPVPTGKTI